MRQAERWLWNETHPCGVPFSSDTHRELINTFKSDRASLESPFEDDNAKTAIVLGMACGAILAVGAENNIPAYAPIVAQLTVTGLSHARKEQVTLMMANEFNTAVSAIPANAPRCIGSGSLPW